MEHDCCDKPHYVTFHVHSHYYQHSVLDYVLQRNARSHVDNSRCVCVCVWHAANETMPPSVLTILSLVAIVNLVIAVIFLLEMAFKLLAMGLRDYLNFNMNLLDGGYCGFLSLDYLLHHSCYVGCIAIAGLIDMCTPGNTSAVTVFRALRLLRIARIFRFALVLFFCLGPLTNAVYIYRTATMLNAVIRLMRRAMKNILQLCLVFFLYLFLMTLIGMQIFGDSMTMTPNLRAGFSDFWWGFLTVFTVITHDSWNSIMWSGMQAIGPGGSVYFIVLLMIGDC